MPCNQRFLLCLVTLALWLVGCTGTLATFTNANAIAVLTSLDADRDSREQAVSSIQSLNAADKERLLAAFDQRNENYGEHLAYVYRTLIQHADIDIVHGLGRRLLEDRYRYHAVAMGIIGDHAAVPYLNTAIRSNVAHEDCKKALRIINQRNSLEHLPYPTRLHFPIEPTIRADVNELRLGDRVTLTAEYKNTSETDPASLYPPWINPFHAISVQGDHVERRQGAIYTFVITDESFRLLEPGESYTVSQTFELAIESIIIDKWYAFDNKSIDMLCLKRVEDGGGWVIARYVEGQPTTLHIAAVHEPDFYRRYVEEYSIEHYDFKDMVTRAVEIECIPTARPVD